LPLQTLPAFMVQPHPLPLSQPSGEALLLPEVVVSQQASQLSPVPPRFPLPSLE